MTKIGDKPHDTSLSGSEKVPLSPDGYATVQEIANTVDELGSWKVFTGDTPWGMTGALFPNTSTALEDGGWFGLGMNGNESDFILTRGDASGESYVEVYSNPNASNIGSGFDTKAINPGDATTNAQVLFRCSANDFPGASLSITTKIADTAQGSINALTSDSTGHLNIKGAAGQTGSAFEVFDENIVSRFAVMPDGSVFLTGNIPAADPHVVGQVWNSSGTLKISAG